MKSKLITALRQAATALENGTFNYKWNTCSKCNCGVLACAITGKTTIELSKMFPNYPNDRFTWQKMVGDYCPVTGVPKLEIIKMLFDAGLNAVDLVQLEDLSNPEVLSRITEKRTVTPGFVGRIVGLKPTIVEELAEITYNNQQDAARYMRAWADLLVEQGQMDTAPQPAAELVQQ